MPNLTIAFGVAAETVATENAERLAPLGGRTAQTAAQALKLEAVVAQTATQLPLETNAAPVVARHGRTETTTDAQRAQVVDGEATADPRRQLSVPPELQASQRAVSPDRLDAVATELTQRITKAEVRGAAQVAQASNLVKLEFLATPEPKVATPLETFAAHTFTALPFETLAAPIRQASVRAEIAPATNYLTAALTVIQALPTATRSTVELTFPGGLSAPAPLGNSGLSALIPYGLLSGTTWLVNYTTRPSADLSNILQQLDQLGEPTFDLLFGTNPAEPFLTFRNLWQQGRNIPERLTGVLLALAYQTQAINQTGKTV